jgi:hypothetical protein
MKNFQKHFIQPLLTLLIVLLYLSCEKDMTAIKPGSNGEEKLLLTGQVVEKQGGSPVAGAVVKALKNQVSDTSDSSGSFRLEGLLPGADTIFVAVPALTLSLTGVLTRVTLQNQTEHSGIMVKLVELDTFTVTDSTGHFQFNKLPDGSYTLEAKYPYFSTEQLNITISDSLIQSEVQIQLRQQLQFWIEPAETTISRSNLGDPYYFSFSRLKLYMLNITSEPVEVGTGLEPIYLWALAPQGFDWPFVQNIDSIPDLCYLLYGWLGAEQAFIWFSFTFQPGDTLVTFVPRPGNTVRKDCVIPGEYLFFTSISDLSHYPEFFHPVYVRGSIGAGKDFIFDKMNRSLLKKRALFNPVNIHIID